MKELKREKSIIQFSRKSIKYFLFQNSFIIQPPAISILNVLRHNMHLNVLYFLQIQCFHADLEKISLNFPKATAYQKNHFSKCVFQHFFFFLLIFIHGLFIVDIKHSRYGTLHSTVCINYVRHESFKIGFYNRTGPHFIPTGFLNLGIRKNFCA